MKKRLIIAIDGPAASGKSTTAKKIAEMLDYIYIDTGAMYRASALAALNKNVRFDEHEKLAPLLDSISIDFKNIEGVRKVFLDGHDVSKRIREADITKLSSEIAVIPLVRKKLVYLQQKMGERGGIVMDGRDIGTVVFPNADIKFFLTASTKIRALRRWRELTDKSVSVEEVEKELLWRDNNDSSREVGPLLKADDAIEIDTTDMSVDEQIDYIYKLIIESHLLG